MVKRFLFVFLFFVTTHSMGQYYLTGVEPFGTKWRQIKTSHFRIIFPLEADKIANRYANLLDRIDSVAPKSLSANQKCFDVVIHNHSMLSNAFVAWAPKRMEIIAQQPSSMYAQPWLTQLAIHETRHTSQLFKLNGGLIKPASYLFGEQIVGVTAGFVPSWFLEGDAVAFETATSNSGRGRQADFYQYYRAHYLTKTKRFKYDKWLLGSFKDNIPNHYNFGYQLVSYVKLEYGDQVWANTLRYVSRYPFTIIPFYFGLKQQTGLSRKQLFKKTFNYLDNLWTINQKSQGLGKYPSMVKANREYTDYRYPFFLNDSSLVVFKTNLSANPRFILVDVKTKKEKTLIRPGYLTSIPSYYKENIFWTEYLPQIRWEYKNFSVIKYYNISTRKVKTIANRGRYFSPAYSPLDGLIYVISGKEDGNNSIEAFSLNGEKRKTIILPNSYQSFEIHINADGKQLIAGVVSDKGKSIVRVNEDGSCELIYGPTHLDIHSISSNGNYILFSTSFEYRENVFALNSKTKKVYQQTKSAYGSTDPAYNPISKEIVFTSYTANGYCVSMAKVDTVSSKVNLKDIYDDLTANRLSSAEKFNIDSTAIQSNIYKIDKYRGFKTLINIHSWAPFYFDPNQLTTGEAQVKLGVTIFSQNLTGSSVLTAGYGYDKVHLARINYQYFGLFPVLSYEFDLSEYPPSLYYKKNTTVPRIEKQRKESTFSVYLPLRLSANQFSTILYPFVKLVSSNDYLFSPNDSLYHKGLQLFNYRIFFSSLQQQTVKGVRPRFGFVADINSENAPFNRNNFGSLFSGDFFLYLPGIGTNHSLLIKHSLQKQNINRFIFSNKITFPRGYLENYSESFRSISFDYLMPIAYPDFAFGSIAYLKRISLNAFYDYAENIDPSKAGKPIDIMKSFGFEIYTDFKFFRTRYPIRLKLQQGWAGDNFLPFNSFSLFIDFYGQ